MNSNVIWGSLGFLVDTLKKLPVSETLTLSENGSCCVSTGTYAENWVYCPECEITPEMAGETVRFFRERGQTCMCPVYDGSDKNIKTLESAGLVYDEELTAMCFSPAERAFVRDDTVMIQQVISREEAVFWAETASLSFGDALTPEYSRFVEGLCAEKERVSLYLAKYCGKCAGTFFVTHEPDVTGVYYFAVRSEFRRKGIAREMMAEICRLSAEKSIVLQAAPMGAKFYRAFGFEELFSIPLFRIADS